MFVVVDPLIICWFVSGIPVAKRDEMKRKSVKEGESVTLDPGVTKKTNVLMAWYFNDTIIQSKICTDDQCKERFRDRLKLDHQTGSLTITNTRTTDSGLYQLQINSSRFSIIRLFTVTVTGECYFVIQRMLLCSFRIQFNILK